jgi:hypothetical protein
VIAVSGLVGRVVCSLALVGRVFCRLAVHLADYISFAAVAVSPEARIVYSDGIGEADVYSTAKYNEHTHTPINDIVF